MPPAVAPACARKAAPARRAPKILVARMIAARKSAT
jgi:hypothetical protein